MTGKLEARPGESITVFSGSRGGDPLGSISIPTRDHLNAASAMSIIYTDWSWCPPGRPVSLQITQGSVLTAQRNEAIRRMQGDWVLFIDDDMVWSPDAVGRLVKAREENDLDMVGGLCFRRSEPYHPTLYMRERPNAGLYNFLETWPEDEIVEVDATGCAFLLIHRRVFEMIAGAPLPSHEELMARQGPPPPYFRWDGSLGEDLRFCQEAKDAGARIWIDTSIKIGHVAEVTITERDFLMQVAQRDEETYEARKAINDSMNFPTLSAAQAKERLGWT